MLLRRRVAPFMYAVYVRQRNERDPGVQSLSPTGGDFQCGHATLPRPSPARSLLTEESKDGRKNTSITVTSIARALIAIEHNNESLENFAAIDDSELCMDMVGQSSKLLQASVRIQAMLQASILEQSAAMSDFVEEIQKSSLQLRRFASSTTHCTERAVC